MTALGIEPSSTSFGSRTSMIRMFWVSACVLGLATGISFPTWRDLSEKVGIGCVATVTFSMCARPFLACQVQKRSWKITQTAPCDSSQVMHGQVSEAIKFLASDDSRPQSWCIEQARTNNTHIARLLSDRLQLIILDDWSAAPPC